MLAKKLNGGGAEQENAAGGGDGGSVRARAARHPTVSEIIVRTRSLQLCLNQSPIFERAVGMPANNNQ